MQWMRVIAVDMIVVPINNNSNKLSINKKGVADEIKQYS